MNQQIDIFPLAQSPGSAHNKKDQWKI